MLRLCKKNGICETTRVHQIDIKADIPSKEGIEDISCIIEVKGSWNTEVKTNMKTQLKDKYLKEKSSKFGLYLVGWYWCKKWNDDDPRKINHNKEFCDLTKLRDILKNQEQNVSDENHIIRSFVLDASLSHR